MIPMMLLHPQLCPQTLALGNSQWGGWHYSQRPSGENPAGTKRGKPTPGEHSIGRQASTKQAKKSKKADEFYNTSALLLHQNPNSPSKAVVTGHRHQTRIHKSK